MNRIFIEYTPRQEQNNIDSRLIIGNDIKGVTYKQIGPAFYGEDADLMLKLLQNVNYDNIDDCMNYGIKIKDEENELSQGSDK